MITALLICLAPVVVDGDTLRCGNMEPTIRIWGISAPERRAPGGTESTAALVPLVAGGVLCEPKGTSFTRIVAQCFNAKNVDVGKAQLESGHATEWCGFSKNYYGRCQ